MKEFEALKNIWDGQAAHPEISPHDILKRVRKTKRGFAQKLLFETISAAIIIVLLAVMWINNPFMMWTTHLSMFIFICCCVYYLFVQYHDYRSMNTTELLLKQPGEYLEYLKAYRSRRYQLNTRKYTIYSIFIGLAFALYFIEVYFTAPLWMTLLGIVLIAAWYMICWFLMRSYIRREEENLGNMIGNLERMKKQFGETYEAFE